MSGGTLVWLTDDELERLIEWYPGPGLAGPMPGDDALRDKLDAKREEVACKVPVNGRTRCA